MRRQFKFGTKPVAGDRRKSKNSIAKPPPKIKTIGKEKKMIGDLDKDGKMSSYEKKRDMAIKKSMAKQKIKNKKKVIG